jgi:hypothetical protein
LANLLQSKRVKLLAERSFAIQEQLDGKAVDWIEKVNIRADLYGCDGLHAVILLEFLGLNRVKPITEAIDITSRK